MPEAALELLSNWQDANVIANDGENNLFLPADDLSCATPKDEADVLLSNGADFGTGERLKIIPVRSPNNGR